MSKRNKTAAAKILLEAGWTFEEINAVLENQTIQLSPPFLPVPVPYIPYEPPRPHWPYWREFIITCEDNTSVVSTVNVSSGVTPYTATQ